MKEESPELDAGADQADQAGQEATPA